MRRLGLPSVSPKPATARPAPAHPVYPYLLRGLAIERPHQAWCTDITYLRLAHGFVYLMAVMDGYTATPRVDTPSPSGSPPRPRP